MAEFKEISPNAAPMQKLENWFTNRFPTAFSAYREHLSEYYAPKNFNFWYFFGSLALLVLVIQIVTGIFLVMNYKPDAALAFARGAVDGGARYVPSTTVTGFRWSPDGRRVTGLETSAGSIEAAAQTSEDSFGDQATRRSGDAPHAPSRAGWPAPSPAATLRMSAASGPGTEPGTEPREGSPPSTAAMQRALIFRSAAGVSAAERSKPSG